MGQRVARRKRGGAENQKWGGVGLKPSELPPGYIHEVLKRDRKSRKKDAESE